MKTVAIFVLLLGLAVPFRAHGDEMGGGPPMGPPAFLRELFMPGLVMEHQRDIGLSPEQRFENHKNGIKAARVVRRFGERLVPKLYAHLNPMSYKQAQFMETALADSLRKRGFVVFGGH